MAVTTETFLPAYTIAAPDNAAYHRLEQAFQQDLVQVNMGSSSLPVQIMFDPAAHTISSGYALDVMQTLLPADSKVMDLLPIRKTLYGLFAGVEGDTFQAGDYRITRMAGNPFIEKDCQMAAAEQTIAQLSPKQSLTPLPPDTPPHKLVTSLLNTHQGVCIGESHIECAARILITQQMEEWKSKGVKKIFLETLRREFNPMLQHYYKMPDAGLPPVVSKWLDQAEENTRKLMLSSYQPNHLLQEIVESGKQQGIEIYGISSAIAAVPGPWSKDATIKRRGFYERAVLFNAIAADTIHSLLAPNEKFVVLTGSNHLGSIPTHVFGKNVFGLDRFLNVPAVILKTCQQGQAPGLEEPLKDREIEHICWLDPAILNALYNKPVTGANVAQPFRRG